MDALAGPSVTFGDAVTAGIDAPSITRNGRGRGLAAAGWIILLLAVLAFLVIYPVAMLLIGALTDSNPVVDGLAGLKPSVDNFTTVLSNPNVLEALANSLIACGGGTLGLASTVTKLVSEGLRLARPSTTGLESVSAPITSIATG